MRTNAIGIDLGTTHACVGVFVNGKVEIIANERGNRKTPTYVAFTNTDRLLGEAAKDQIDTNPVNTVVDAKRLIGRKFNDNALHKDLKHWPFKVVASEAGRPQIQVDYKGETKTFVPEEISAMSLVDAKRSAEAFLGTRVTDAVITVPSNFNANQRRATADAARIAGLNPLRIINESTSAAIAYGLHKEGGKSRNVLIFDLGGGTFDVTILAIEDGFFEVLSTAGDSHLGGEDFNNRLVNHFAAEFRRKFRRDLFQDARALRRLRSACESAKCALSSSTETSIKLDSLLDGIDFSSTLTRARFQELCADLFRNTMDPVEKALRDAKMEKSMIDDIVLVGGSSRIPRIQALLSEFFDDRTLNCSLNPDEAVAYGAAVQAAILSNDKTAILADLLLVDVTPLSLGIESAGGVMDKLIQRNATIPTAVSRTFTARNLLGRRTEGAPRTLFIKVFEGERTLTKDNNYIGSFKLCDFPSSRDRDASQIEITFDIDVKGILTVTAEDKSTGTRKELTIEGQLTEKELKRMIAVAAEFNADDDLKAQTAAKNALISNALRMKEAGEKVLSWFNANPNATTKDFLRYQRKLESVCSAVIGKKRPSVDDNSREANVKRSRRSPLN